MKSLLSITLLLFGISLYSQEEVQTDSIIENYKNKAWELKYSDEAAANKALHLGLQRSKKLRRQADEGYFYRKLISQKGFTGQMDSATYYFKTGIQFAKAQDSLEDRALVGKLHSEMGETSHRNGDMAAAEYHYKKADSIFQAVDDKLGVSIIKLNLGNIYYIQKDYGKAVKLYYEGTQLADTTQYRYIKGSLFNSLSAAYAELGESERSLASAKKSLEEFKSEIEQYPEYVPGAYNNISRKYREEGKYKLATAYIDSADQAIEKYNLEASKINTTVARAEIYLEDGREKEALKILEDNLYLLKKYRLNSEDHFSYEYVLGKAYNELNFKDKALQTLQPLESKADSLQMFAEVGYINEALANIYAEKGQFENAFIAQKKVEKIKDSIYTLEKKTAFKEIDAKYETEKNQRQLAETRATLAERELEVEQKKILLYGSLALAVILGFVGYLFYSQQKMKNRQLKKESELKTALAKIETQNKLQEQRLRISRDLHDNIGSQLTFIISSLDSLKFRMGKENETVTNKLSTISAFTSETIYELRDTIWAMNKTEITFEDLETRIHNFIEKANASKETIAFNFNVSESIPKCVVLSSVQGMNVYRIIQEGVNNALKYSNASNIDVTIEHTNKELTVQIVDNGKGFNISKTEMGNGLNNIKKRAKELGGTSKITSNIGQGTTVSCKFPTA